MKKNLGLALIYEDLKPTEKNSGTPADEASIRQEIDRLPEKWRNAFKTAVAKVDFESAQAMLEKIKIREPKLSDALEEWLNAYRFDLLQKLFEKDASSPR